MKSYLRRSKATGTELHKINVAMRRGWQPGCRTGDYLGGRRRRRGKELGREREW